jgi:hypothetical protein
MRGSWLVVAVGIGICAATLSCLSQQTVQAPRSASDLDRKLSTFAWIEDGKLVTFIVDTRAARYREEAGYVPLEIAVANRGVRNLTITRESFVLMDVQGNRYPAAEPNELLENYDFLDLDRSPQLAELEGLVYDKFAAYTRYPSSFSPTRTIRTGTVRSRLALPRYGYIVDILYFPMPVTGVKNQRFDLFLDAPELEDPIFVKFEVR